MDIEIKKSIDGKTASIDLKNLETSLADVIQGLQDNEEAMDVLQKDRAYLDMKYKKLLAIKDGIN